MIADSSSFLGQLHLYTLTTSQKVFGRNYIYCTPAANGRLVARIALSRADSETTLQGKSASPVTMQEPRNRLQLLKHNEVPEQDGSCW